MSYRIFQMYTKDSRMRECKSFCLVLLGLMMIVVLTSSPPQSEFQTVTAGKYKRTLTPTKQVTQEDLEKSKEDIEEILTLFKEFVHQNRPSLDIDDVATGETWFGSAAMDKGLCDEIRAVDDVLLDHVKNGYQVLDVKYTPPKEKESLKQLLGVRGGKEQKSLVGKAVQWFVQTVASEIKSELEDSRGIQQKYMMKDDTKDRYRL